MRNREHKDMKVKWLLMNFETLYWVKVTSYFLNMQKFSFRGNIKT